MKLPTEGVPGTNMDDLHCIAAAQRVRGDDFTPTAAEKLRIERGRELLAPPSIRDLV